MAATHKSELQPAVAERRVLDVLESATEPSGLKAEEIAVRSGVSVRSLATHLRRLRGKGKVECIRGKHWDVFYRRKRYGAPAVRTAN